MNPRAFPTIAMIAAGGILVLSAPASLASEPLIEAVRVEARGPILDPAAAFWEEAPATTVALMPQLAALPHQPNPIVTELQVRAVHNGEWLAVLLQWRDETRDDWIRTDEFGDQAAIQFPAGHAEGLPSPMMGHAGGPVNILQWRAPFQRDLVEGEPTVHDLYPYALVDLYPDEVLRVVDTHAYMGALGVDNPVSRPFASPVLDQFAEGWGTLTANPMQHADGYGDWKEGVWRVVVTRPMHPLHAHEPDLRPGTETSAAFAVWEGGDGDVGARKSWSAWVPLRIAD